MQDLTREFEGRKGRERDVTWLLRPAAGQPPALCLRSPGPRILRPAPANSSDPPHPASARVPPHALTLVVGPPGAPGIGWQVDCLRRLLLHLDSVSEPCRKQPGAEFRFDPHGEIHGKLRALSPGPALAFVVGSAYTAVRRFHQDPCPLRRPGWSWGRAL